MKIFKGSLAIILLLTLVACKSERNDLTGERECKRDIPENQVFSVNDKEVAIDFYEHDLISTCLIEENDSKYSYQRLNKSTAPQIVSLGGVRMCIGCTPEDDPLEEEDDFYIYNYDDSIKILDVNGDEHTIKKPETLKTSTNNAFIHNNRSFSFYKRDVGDDQTEVIIKAKELDQDEITTNTLTESGKIKVAGYTYDVKLSLYYFVIANVKVSDEEETIIYQVVAKAESE